MCGVSRDLKGRITALSPLAAANGFVWPWPAYNTWFLGLTWVSSPPKRHIGRFSRFCRAHEVTDAQTDTQL